jgi:hypothetical protein
MRHGKQIAETLHGSEGMNYSSATAITNQSQAGIHTNWRCVESAAWQKRKSEPAELKRLERNFRAAFGHNRVVVFYQTSIKSLLKLY